MLHLRTERLASLADEPPAAHEREHLALCPECSRERDAYLRLREVASAESTRLAPPISDWTGIAAGLRAEGVLPPEHTDTFVVPTTVLTQRRMAKRWWARAAAAVVLLAGGVIGGRVSAGASPLPFGPEAGAALARAAIDTVTVVMGDSLPAFRSAREALAHLTSAERQYQYAAAYLGQFDSTAMPVEDSSQAYQARLAALDNVMAATREALYQAPHDQVINRYYLATLGARAATIRQLNTVLPAGAQVSRY